MKRVISRRDFLKIVGFGSLTLATRGVFPLGSSEEPFGKDEPDLVVAEDGSPKDMVRAAVGALGGMDKFIGRDKSVVVKPNIAWARTPSQAANTDPEVVEEIVKLCYQAGASRVIVMDHTCNNYLVTYEKSGIKAAAQRAKAVVKPAHEQKYYERVVLPKAKIMKECEILKDILAAGALINVPVAKVHGGATVTLSMKNLMGTVWDRGFLHKEGLHQCIADLSTYVKPQLIIMDAVRILTTKGPQGPGEVLTPNKIVAGTDPVALDAYGTELLGKKAEDIPHIVYAHKMGIGEINLDRLNIKKINLAKVSWRLELAQLFS